MLNSHIGANTCSKVVFFLLFEHRVVVILYIFLGSYLDFNILTLDAPTDRYSH